jgi:hypothetical protein
MLSKFFKYAFSQRSYRVAFVDINDDVRPLYLAFINQNSDIETIKLTQQSL